MSFELVELIGFAASALVFLTFCMQTLLPLRLIATFSNVLFIAYSAFAGLAPILILHALLLPVNVWRLVQQLRLRRRVRSVFSQAPDIDMLSQFMTADTFTAGSVVFRAGDTADRLYVVLEGEVLVEGVGHMLRKGDIFGEIGLFSEQGQRTATVRAIGPVSVAWIDRGTVMKVFEDQPDFALSLTKLIASRLTSNQQTASDQKPAI